MSKKPKVKYEPYSYLEVPHKRRHGPYGYKNYEYYRDWLRDEFCFRCVFCLTREEWGERRGRWEIDHFIPQSKDRSKALEYENLLYVCKSCNSIKSNSLTLNPCEVAFGKCLKVNPDGTIEALNRSGSIIIRDLRLDNDDRTRSRHRIIKTIESFVKNNDTKALTLYFRFPDDLPDLSKIKPQPKGNTKPEGVNESFYARHSRGELPETY